jgi:hypothetical protein
MSGVSFTGGDSTQERLLPRKQAESMVALFLSVDRDRFDLALASPDGEVSAQWEKLEAAETFDKLADLLPHSGETSESVLIRPLSRGRSSDPTLLCVDTDAENRAKLSSLSFLTLELPQHRFQCWLAVDTGNWRNAASLRDLLASNDRAAALSAQKRYLLPGSPDAKAGGGPVKLVEGIAGRVISVAQLERADVRVCLASAQKV